MNVTLGGRYENALIGQISSQIEHFKGWEMNNPYYAGLFRRTSKSYFDRCATFIAISDKIVLPEVDWTIPPRTTGITPVQFGITQTRAGGNEWDVDAQALSALALSNNAFRPETLQVLTSVASLNLPPRPYTRPPGFGLPHVDGFAHHHLCRLLLQIRASVETKSFLILGDEDRQILTELVQFVVEHQLPTPFDLPDLSRMKVVDGESLAGGLFNFSPPDALSVIAVRADPTIAQYAAQVRSALVTENSFTSQRDLVMAMRAALEKSEISERVHTIFEVDSWICKALHFVPVVGVFFAISDVLLELADKWMRRKDRSDEWFMLGPRMADISLKDYLRRMDNV
jgi:hypothetical protein